MTTTGRTAVLCGVALIAGAVVMGLRPQESTVLAQGPAGRTTWEYQTLSVDLPSLAARLNELGGEGWEVFSIISTDGVVDTQADTKPHVLCQRVEVTAKRPRTR